MRNKLIEGEIYSSSQISGLGKSGPEDVNSEKIEFEQIKPLEKKMNTVETELYIKLNKEIFNLQ